MMLYNLDEIEQRLRHNCDAYCLDDAADRLAIAQEVFEIIKEERKYWEAYLSPSCQCSPG